MNKSILIPGDILALAAITLIGFATHGDRRQLWRPGLAMIFGAPIAVILRAVMLSGVALPLFTIILGSTAALGMIIWRGIYSLISRRRN
jgi:hypothetical protein